MMDFTLKKGRSKMKKEKRYLKAHMPIASCSKYRISEKDRIRQQRQLTQKASGNQTSS